MASFTDRMIGAAKLDVHTYEEVEADTAAMGQSMAVVVLSSVAAGIGAAEGMIGLLVGSLAALVGWFVWAFVTYLIGTKILPEPQTEADVGQLLRTTGFSAAPGLLRVFGLIPGIGMLAVGVASTWMLVSITGLGNFPKIIPLVTITLIHLIAVHLSPILFLNLLM